MPAEGTARVVVPDNSGGHFSSPGAPFFALATVDSDAGGNVTHDWGFAMVPEDNLTEQILIGLGLGRDPGSASQPGENGGPIWVTPVCDTTLFVDFPDGVEGPDPVDLDGDGTAEANTEAGIVISELESLRIFRPDAENSVGPNDQTGAFLWTEDGSGDAGCRIAAAWGQDPRTASAGAPAIDVGTVIPPMPLLSAGKGVNPIQAVEGDTVTYTITIENVGRVPVPDVYVFDNLPTEVTYAAGTTVLDKNDGNGPASIPDDLTGSAFPLDNPGTNPSVPDGYLVAAVMPVGAEWTITFEATINDGVTGDAIVNEAKFSWFGEETTRDISIQLTGMTFQKTVYSGQDNGASCPGGEQVTGTAGTGITYCFTVTNVGNTDVDLIAIVDPQLDVDMDDLTLVSGSLPLGPDESITYYYESTVPQGGMDNTATATGNPVDDQGDDIPGLDNVTATDTASVAEAVPAAITGTVYDDRDGTAANAFDGSDTPIGGVSVALYAAGPDGLPTGDALATTLTDASGGYSFSGVLPGDYVIVQTDLSGYDSVTDIDGTTSNDANQVAVTLNGTDVTGRDFLDIRRLVTISGQVFDDRTGTTGGDFDAADAPVEGVTVELFAADQDGAPTGSAIASATTDATGAYSFTGVDWGEYVVVETDLANYASVTDEDGATTNTVNQIAVNVTGSDVSGQDFLDASDAAIVGTVYEDVDGDRMMDPAEIGIAGVTVRLLDGNGVEVATTTTDSSGAYRFIGLVPGDYRVVELDPAGYESTTDNDVAVSLALYATAEVDFGDIDVAGGDSALLLDAAAYCENDIPYVTYSVTPVGISPDSVTIRWDNVPDYTETLLDQPLSNTVLLWPGAAVVDGVGVAWPGWEIVDGAWVPVTDPRRGPLEFTVIVNPEQTVTLTYPPATPECAAGPSQISGRVYEDGDGSTTQETAEPGISGVTIELLDGGGNVIATTQTDSSGFYSFTGIEPGSYTVREVDPGGYVSTTGNEVPVTLGIDSFPVVDFGDLRSALTPVAVPLLSPAGLILLVLGIGLLAGHGAGRRRSGGKM